MNYFSYLQPGGEIQESQKKGLARFVDHKKTNISPREFDNASSAKEIASGLAYIIPGYGTYISIKDTVVDPTQFNIGSDALSGLEDLAMFTDFGISGKAPVAENRALQTARFAKAADKGLYAGRATNQIENGKKIIKTTELTEFPKEVMNIATYGDRKFELGGEMNYFSFLKSGGSIHIKPENKGKFTATKKRTGKTTEELTHSKNPITRKRAIFAQNAKKWNHKK